MSRKLPNAIRYPVAPRDVPPEKAARRLHLTLAEFNAMKEELSDRGFPRPDPTTGMYDLVAVERWMDARSGIAPAGGLTGSMPLRNAEEVAHERLRRLRG
jgi:hypothetical protein